MFVFNDCSRGDYNAKRIEIEEAMASKEVRE